MCVVDQLHVNNPPPPPSPNMITPPPPHPLVQYAYMCCSSTHMCNHKYGIDFWNLVFNYCIPRSLGPTLLWKPPVVLQL